MSAPETGPSASLAESLDAQFVINFMRGMIDRIDIISEHTPGWDAHNPIAPPVSIEDIDTEVHLSADLAVQTLQGLGVKSVTWLDDEGKIITGAIEGIRFNNQTKSSLEWFIDGVLPNGSVSIPLQQVIALNSVPIQ